MASRFRLKRKVYCHYLSTRSLDLPHSLTMITRGVALEADEKPRLVRDLGSKRFLMLRNHGLLTVGRSVAEAFVAMYFF